MGSLLRVMESLGLEQHRPQEVRRALAVHQAASSTVLCRHRGFFLQYLFKPRVSGKLTSPLPALCLPPKPVLHLPRSWSPGRPQPAGICSGTAGAP